MKFFIAPLLVAALSTGPLSPPAAPDLFEEFRAVCLDWDADPEAAEEIALERGYEPSQDLIPDDLLQPVGLNVWSRTADGVEWRVLTKRKGLNSGAIGNVDHDRCYVSATPARVGPIREAVRRHVGFNAFSQRRTHVFAWLPSPDGLQPVRRAVFEHTGAITLTRRGMRMILVREHEGQVMLTYITPLER